MAYDRFARCIRDNLIKAKGFGKTRVDANINLYNRLKQKNLAAGMTMADAGTDAMAQVMQGIEATIKAKQANIMTTAKIITDYQDVLDMAAAAKGAIFGRGTAAQRVALALKSRLEGDVRIKDKNNFVAQQEIAHAAIAKMFRDTVDFLSRNWLGIRRGEVDYIDVANELIKPGSTNNTIARDIAKAWREGDDYAMSELSRSGVTIKRLAGEVPFHPSAAKMSRYSRDEFVEYMKDKVDWSRSGGGTFILPEERADWLGKYYDAVSSRNWKHMPDIPEYTGGQFAKDYHNDRLIQFTDGQAYMDAHTKFMDGDLIQTNMARMEKLSFNIARAKVFGPSPDHMYKVMRQMTEDRIVADTPRGQSNRGGRLLTRADRMKDIAFKANSMDPESGLGMAVGAAGNVMSASMLNHAVFMSLPGDIMSALSNMMRNHERWMLLPGAILKALIFTKQARKDLLAMGHALSYFTNEAQIQTRYGMMTEVGGTFTRMMRSMADKVMRLNLMTRGFDAVRAADLRVRAMTIWGERDVAWSNLRIREMLERNNITEADWKRTAGAMNDGGFSPADGIEMFRPLDHAKAMGDDLTNKWMSLFYHESRQSVFEASLESRAILTAGHRPDDMVGALVNSFSRFHSYPVTYSLAMARQFMSMDNVSSRMGFLVRMGLLSTLGATIGIQLKNLWQGKEPEDMTTFNFWALKAIPASGALGMWGDFLTNSARPGPKDAIIQSIGGPYVQFIADAIDKTMGSAWQAFELGQAQGEWSASKAGIELSELFRRNLMPQTFYTAPLFQRYLFEPFYESLDNKRMQRSYKAQQKSAERAGAPFRPGYGPGSRAPFPFTGGQ